LHRTVALPHTAACAGFELGFGGGWRECVVRNIYLLFDFLLFFAFGSDLVLAFLVLNEHQIIGSILEPISFFRHSFSFILKMRESNSVFFSNFSLSNNSTKHIFLILICSPFKSNCQFFLEDT
jgi:hypothetical protein